VPTSFLIFMHILHYYDRPRYFTDKNSIIHRLLGLRGVIISI
jgi:hypothetical protein